MEGNLLPIQANSFDISNILLIDDKEENLTSFELVLETPCRKFLKASNGNDGIALARNHDISLILLDIQMPGLSGFEVMQVLKSSSKTENIPIIFVSGIGKDPRFMLQGLQDGAVDFIHKPVSAELLRAKVNVFLKLERQRKEIERQNRVLQTLGMMVEHSADLMCILHKETLEFEEINPAFGKMLGYSGKDLLNEKIIHLFADLKDVLAFEYKLQRYKNVRTREMHFECKLKGRDGSYKWVSLSITEQFDKWFVNGQDITQLKLMETRLRNYSKDLEQFTQIITHEIKAPLNSGRYYVNLIRHDLQSENISTYTDNVLQYLQRAEKLVDEINIYALSKEEKNYMLLHASEIVEEAIRNLQFEINARQASVRFKDLPDIYGIESQLIILFQNLISNSLKLCRDKNPEITVSALEIKDKVIFIYNDNSSVGFNRSSSSGASSGDVNPLKERDIHLRICDTIAKRHGGTITYESTEDKGTNYFISILKRKKEKKPNHE